MRRRKHPILPLRRRTLATLVALTLSASCSDDEGGRASPNPAAGETTPGEHSTPPALGPVASQQPPLPGQPGTPAASPDAPATPADPGTQVAPPGNPNPPPDGISPTAPGTEHAGGAALPPRIRRLSTLELAATLNALVPGARVSPADFVPDARQSGYTRNSAQVVDSVLAGQLQKVVERAVAEHADVNLWNRFGSCASGGNGDATCGREILGGMLTTAYRRPPSDIELDSAMAVYEVGATGGGLSGGLSLALQAILQSASFLYHTEVGENATPQAQVTLTSHETASQLAYFLTGGPPDAELLQAAADGALAQPQARAEQARRILATDAAKGQVGKMIKQWLGIDLVVEKAKSAEHFPEVNFEQVRLLMAEESDAFIAEVVFNDGAEMETLLNAEYTVLSQELAEFYGIDGSPGLNGRTSLAGTARKGILTQGSFLSTYASEIESSPVQRGNAMLRHLACLDTPSPASVNLQQDVTPPKPDAAMTTRDRFAQHSDNEACRICHAMMDPFGFSFENFDAVGRQRATENGVAINTVGTLQDGLVPELNGWEFQDSAELIGRLAVTETAAACFSRNAARFAGASTTDALETGFLAVREALPEADRNNILELLVAFASSDIFIQRSEEWRAQ